MNTTKVTDPTFITTSAPDSRGKVAHSVWCTVCAPRNDDTPHRLIGRQSERFHARATADDHRERHHPETLPEPRLSIGVSIGGQR